LVAVANIGGIYTYPALGVIATGAQSVSGQLEYVGNGQWDAVTPNEEALLNANQTFTGANTFVGVINGNGGGLTNLNAAKLIGALPAISGLSLTSLNAASLTGALPKIDGFNLISLPGSPSFNSISIGVSSITHALLDVGVNTGLYTGYYNLTAVNREFTYNSGTTLGNLPSNITASASIYAAGDIATAGFFIATSDARVKIIKGRSDAGKDLASLQGIEVTDFRYKDVIAHGTGPQKKVIAQQVEKVFPQAVSKHTDAVPDIYKPAACKDGWVVLATDLKEGERVKLIGGKAEGVYQVLEVAKDRFRTDFKPAGDKVFVYGREVNDFRAVDYDAIAMLNVSATQELARQSERNTSKLETLEKEVAELKKMVGQLAQANKGAGVAAELAARTSAATVTEQSLPTVSLDH
jgi:hypothetical protein